MMKFFKGCLMFISGFFVLLVVAAMIFGGDKTKTASNDNSGSTSPTTESQEPGATQDSNSPPTVAETPEMIPVGTEANVRDDRVVLVEGSEIVDSIQTGNQFMEPVQPEGGQLVVVYMTLKNTGKESGNMLWTQFQLVDNQDRKYDEIKDFKELVSINTWLDAKGLSKTDEQIFPGGNAKTAKVFRVAPDASGLKLSVNSKNFSIE